MLHLRSRLAAALGFAFLSVLISGAARNSTQRKPAPVTFNRNIAPIIFHNCSTCHRPGEPGPFPLLNYADVKKHGHQIVTVTRERFMPPWLPEPQTLKFADERRLTNQQIDLLRQWVEQGEAEGNAADLPALPRFAEGWELGKPDLIVKADEPFLLPASGTDTYWNFVLRLPIQKTRWLKAIEIRPGDKRVVHHANILVDRMENARHMESAPGAGFGGMELRIESETFDPDSHFLFWKPGTVPYVEPDGMALRLDKGTDLVLNTHLQPSGKTETIQPSVGLYFTDNPATQHPMLLQMEADEQLNIPAGDKNFVVTDEFRLPLDADLLAIYPHAHYLGKDIAAFATLPNGQRESLIHIPNWDLNWQAVYRYGMPVPLPRDTVVSMRYVYDNSEDNIRNPNHPPKRVTAGNRASDEMAHLWLQVLPHSDGTQVDPRMILQEALARHTLEKNPHDFASLYNLGAMMQARGDAADAITNYRAALNVRPHDALANNALGGALLAGGQASEAIPHFSEAITSRPDYFDAHYNLGSAYAALGQFQQAADQFREAVRLRPDDAGAEADFGAALAQLGDLPAAKAHFEHALELDPKNQLARENLQQVLRDMKQ